VSKLTVRAKIPTVQEKVGKRSMRDLNADERAVTEMGRTILSGQLCVDTAFPSADEIKEMVVECIVQAAVKKSLAPLPVDMEGKSARMIQACFT
jgi:hypothetical protein